MTQAVRIALCVAVGAGALGTAWAFLPQALPFRAASPPPVPVAATTPAVALPPVLPRAPDAGAGSESPIAPAVAGAGAGRAASGAATPPPVAPRFDVARVGARGMLVVAGRAAPGAEVVLLDGERDIGRGRADARGEWVILPADPLPPGARELALTARVPGGDPVRGAETVVLVVPEPAAPGPAAGASASAAAGGPDQATPAPAQPLAVLLPPIGAASAPRMLQAGPPTLHDTAGMGTGAAAQAGGGAPRARLGIDVVDYDDGGDMRFAGSAPAGARVRVYAGPAHLGDAQADATGRWHLTPEAQPGIGRHTLRVDQIAATGSVAARVEVPFQRERLDDDALVRDGRVVVQPGHTLWRIARRAYGRGMRYTIIYDANRAQIADPRRIYPGQVFAVPEAPPPSPPAVAPAASSRSR